jgi:hypothetical protein
MNEIELIELGESEVSNLLVNDNNETNCAICLEINNENSKVLNTGCNHKFHEKCIEELLQHHNKCPICKKKIKITNKIITNNIIKNTINVIYLIIIIMLILLPHKLIGISNNPLIYNNDCSMNLKYMFDNKYYKTKGNIVNSEIITNIKGNDIEYILVNKYKYENKFCKDLNNIIQENKDNAIIFANIMNGT